MVDVVELVGGEAAFVNKFWRGLLVGPQGRVVLRTFFSSPFPAVLSPLQIVLVFMGSCFFFLSFCGEIILVSSDVGVSADAGTAGDIVFLGIGSTAVGFLVSEF